jgi:N-acetylglucosaminyl-diphospho-decaprenol L-rhamnosyltransferase
MSSTLDIVLVNWNAGGMLRECLESLVECDRTGFELQRVVVVDNASSDTSLQNLANLNLPLVTIVNAANLGFAVACNQGASQSKSDFLLFLNPDTRLFKDSLWKSLRFLQDPMNAEIGVLGIQMKDVEGRVWRTCSNLPTAAGFLSAIVGLNRFFPKTFKTHLMLEWDHADSRNVDHVMGAFYLVRRALFRRLGGFDERYFVYLEDVDFSLRVKQDGAMVYYYAGATAYHKGGGVSGQAKSDRLFYSLRSRIQYSYKHFGRFAATLVCLGTLCFEPFTRIVLAMSRLSWGTIGETISAYYRLWISLPSLLTNNRWVND